MFLMCSLSLIVLFWFLHFDRSSVRGCELGVKRRPVQVKKSPFKMPPSGCRWYGPLISAGPCGCIAFWSVDTSWAVFLFPFFIMDVSPSTDHNGNFGKKPLDTQTDEPLLLWNHWYILLWKYVIIALLILISTMSVKSTTTLSHNVQTSAGRFFTFLWTVGFLPRWRSVKKLQRSVKSFQTTVIYFLKPASRLTLETSSGDFFFLQCTWSSKEN